MPTPTASSVHRPRASAGWPSCRGDLSRQEASGLPTTAGALARSRASTSRVNPVNVAALHLGWPWPFNHPRAQGARLAGNWRVCAGSGIVAGDFNAVPWSWDRASNWPARAGFGLSRGWAPPGSSCACRTGCGAPRAGLPIPDHILAKDGHRSSTSSSGATIVGSDHLPVVMEFPVTRQTPRQQVHTRRPASPLRDGPRRAGLASTCSDRPALRRAFQFGGPRRAGASHVRVRPALRRHSRIGGPETARARLTCSD